jgi:hypothetical protein
VGGAGAATPDSPGVAGRRPESVVVLVPGVTGSALRDPATGRLAWGSGARLLAPRDGGRELALPVVPGERCGPALEASHVIEEMSLLGLARKPIYGPLVRLLAAHGFPPGDLTAPQPGERFFPFAYDWRRDTVETAGLLAERLVALAASKATEREVAPPSGGKVEPTTGGPAAGRLPVTLLCQSGGGQICRWLAKYGSASLEEAEAGRPAPLPGVAIAKLILVGTANGGSLRILRMLNRGRTYLGLLGRRWEPETLFTFPSLYQDLPAYRGDFFVDRHGRPQPVDLFDPESWRRFGWSIWGEETRRRVAGGLAPPCFGDEASRRAFLAGQLDRARRFHRLVAADSPGFAGTPYHSLQSLASETPARAVLDASARGWRTLFHGDRGLGRRPDLRRWVSSPGDLHATAESQLHLSPQERAALAGRPLYLEGRHFEMILEPAALERILEIVTATPTPPAADVGRGGRSG